ncbi:putative FBD-associated F-box protein At3g12840 isoform X4 [Ipomoea triloba]|uniref:putative FBD-associated F-box protein At3g12840 isoform X4 n=1 Tax=Ipomoea triloba TaxID=35885 RepID=UPI00125E2074|nr:putative FBD-associated F-box protein At3g12840 isoform X4 [Ipomoea triloba]
MAGSSIEIVPDARRDLISELPAKAQTKHQRIVPDANRDLISELPLELKVSILECLPTRDAARTVLLSTHWNDVWLRLGRLAFDKHFFCDIRKCSDGLHLIWKQLRFFAWILTACRSWVF